MLQKTRGIVFQKIKYSDTSFVVKIYTEHFGLQSYIINGVHAKRSSTRINIFQPLALVELVAYQKEKKQLQRIKEIKIDVLYQQIPLDIAKTSIVFFINEILLRSIKEEEPNPFLFEFIYSALQLLDLEESACVDFHIRFMIQLSKFLGFAPQGNFTETSPYFDLQEGFYKPSEPSHAYFLNKELSEVFFDVCNAGTNLSVAVKTQSNTRKILLEKMIQYYDFHLHNLKDIQSHKIFEELFA